MKENIRKHDEKQIIEAIENSKSLKQARRNRRPTNVYYGEETHIHDKDRIVKEFYKELRSRRASIQDSHGDRTTPLSHVLTTIRS